MSKTISRRSLLVAASALCASTTAPIARAQENKTSPVRIIVPASAGSALDLIARTAQDQLRQELDRPTFVENIPGAGGIIAISNLVRSKPDGSTLCLISNSHVITPYTLPNVTYNALEDVTPLGNVGTLPLVLVGSNKLAANDFKEFQRIVKGKGTDSNYASPGTGTINEFALASLKHEAGLQSEQINYKGSAAQVTAVLSGECDYTISAAAVVLPQIEAGRLRAIGLCSATRSSFIPALPTLAEQGLANFSIDAWFALVGPPKMSAELTKPLNEAIQRAYSSPKVKESLLKQAITVTPSTAAAAASFLRTEYERYGQLSKLLEKK